MQIIKRFIPSVRVWSSLAALSLLFILTLVSQATADNGMANQKSHMISIYDRGEVQAIVSRAETVRGALEQAGIVLSDLDIVEPALNEKLVSTQYNINVYRAQPVIVVDGNTEVKTLTAEQSPAAIAKSADMTLYPEDKTQLVRADKVLENAGVGLRLEIDRATPFSFVLYGKEIPTARTQASTVGEMLAEKNIKLGKDDGTSVPLTTPIVAGMSVSVWRNGVQTLTQDEEIPMPVEQVKDQDREVGYKQVRTPGKPGKKTVTYKINMQNGKEVSREKITEVEILPPVKQVEVLGAKFSNTFSGSFAEALARLRQCEAGGIYDRNSGNGYYGAYQYDISTWGGYQGFARADLAPPPVQDQKVWETYQRRGWQPWPSCKIKMGLQDIYR